MCVIMILFNKCKSNFDNLTTSKQTKPHSLPVDFGAPLRLGTMALNTPLATTKQTKGTIVNHISKGWRKSSKESVDLRKMLI